MHLITMTNHEGEWFALAPDQAGRLIRWTDHHPDAAFFTKGHAADLVLAFNRLSFRLTGEPGTARMLTAVVAAPAETAQDPGKFKVLSAKGAKE